jgi:hypothetical protein
MAKTCSHEDTRLTCIDCNAPICSNCMVQCPVGFRCKSCGTAESSVKRSGAVGGAVKLFGLSVVVGAGTGWAMNYFSVPIFNCVLYFFVGLISGRWLAKFIDYQLRDRSGKIVVLGTLLGMCFTPLANIPPAALYLLTMAFTSSPQSIFPAIWAILGMLFSPICFFAGLVRSTM